MVVTVRPRRQAVPAVLLSLLLALAGARAANAGTAVDAQQLAQAGQDPANWIQHGRTQSEQRYSPLDQINTGNVGQLGLAWYLNLGTNRGLEGTPLAVDGILYFTGPWSAAYAVDARSGKLLWKNDLHVDRDRGRFACCDVVNRGMAMWNGKLYLGTIDGRLVALDAATGQIVWDKLTVDPKRPYTITGAPRVVKGKVLIGNGGAEYGVRGYVSAYDAETGELAWRFYTVPGDPSQPFENPILAKAATTWDAAGKYWEIGGGGTVWDSMAYDPDLDLLYIGVGNGSPWNRFIRSPSGGDNLFLSSIVALRPETGEYVWHYQTTPGEGWDYTATQHLILADIQVDGERRPVIMQAPKNGFFYVLDRRDGRLISAKNYVHVSWAKEIDLKTGRPVQTDNSYKDHGVYQFPSPMGGHNWQPMCFHPDTGYVYIPARELAMIYRQDKGFEYNPNFWNVGMEVMKDVTVPAWMPADLVKNVGAATAQGFLLAWDPVRQREVWRHNSESPWNSGALCAGKNLVFEGTGRGYLDAYDASTGERLWHYDAQQGVIGSPVTYTIDGEQYVSVLVGWGGAFGLSFGFASNTREEPSTEGRLMTFKLGGQAQLPPVARPRRLPEPPPQTASREEVAQGAKLYHHYCVYCHGPGAIGHPNLADLRYMDAETHRSFDAIVLGGALRDRGMVSFAGLVSPEQSRLIHAYLIELGHNTREAEQARGSLWSRVKHGTYAVLAQLGEWGVDLLRWLKSAAG
jgi:PQQ-dependent dehydrogenase (methanol/ethanol family)